MIENDRIYSQLLKSHHPQNKMALLAGPRQVGKTTIAKALMKLRERQGLYLNYDITEDRRRIVGEKISMADIEHGPHRPLIVFDELHKMRLFKRWLKGFYDRYRDQVGVIVTGSGRLDLFQKGGDSLLGRYFLYRIHPLSAAEIHWREGQPISSSGESFWENLTTDRNRESDIDLDRLLIHGGFPEPYLTNDITFTRRWRDGRRERVTREDIRDLTRIVDLDRLDLLVDLLGPKVGSPLSINNLRGDLEVAFETVRAWIGALERVYYIYGLSPWSKKIARSLTKERKIYFWDWSEAPDLGARFENMVVSHFLKAVDYWNDAGLGHYSLHYVRNKQKEETDLLVVEDKKPTLLVEIKSSDRIPSAALAKHALQLGIKRALQIVGTPGIHDVHRERGSDLEIRVVSASTALRYLV